MCCPSVMEGGDIRYGTPFTSPSNHFKGWAYGWTCKLTQHNTRNTPQWDCVCRWRVGDRFSSSYCCYCYCCCCFVFLQLLLPPRFSSRLFLVLPLPPGTTSSSLFLLFLLGLPPPPSFSCFSFRSFELRVFKCVFTILITYDMHMYHSFAYSCITH